MNRGMTIASGTADYSNGDRRSRQVATVNDRVRALQEQEKKKGSTKLCSD